MRTKTTKIATVVMILALPCAGIGQLSLPLDDVLQESSQLLADRQMQAAVDLLEEQLEYHPDSVEVINNLAIAYLGAGRFDEAQQLLHDLVESDPVFRIVAHNLLEFENSDSGTQPIDPLLFVQTAESWYETEVLNGNISPAPAEPVSLVSPQPAPQEQALPPALVTKPSEPEVRQMVERWKDAWVEKNLNAYFSYYSEDFQPRSGTALEWHAERTEKINNPSNIDIQLDNFDISIYSNEIRARFDQRYESPIYRDHVRKLLVIDNTDGEWKIVRESTLEIYEIY
jgi:ketosteroid isomerase-like protein